MAFTIALFLSAEKNVIVYIRGSEKEQAALAGGVDCSDLTTQMKDETPEAPLAAAAPYAREFDTADTLRPQIAVLGQAPFTTLVTNAGGGETRFGAIAVTRWRSDPTLDDSGHWCYVNDLTSGRVWSAGFQPTCVEPHWYKARFDEDSVSFHRQDGEIETLMEIVVPADEAIEVRRVTLTNRSARDAEVELTSCAEIVIAPFDADRGHPAFSNLFVQTEWIGETNTVLAMRRPRSADIDPVWCGQSLCLLDGSAADVSCETDRAKFVGRGRSYRNPIAMGNRGKLSGSTGSVLDPVFSLRARLAIPAGGSTSVGFVTFMASSRSDAMRLASAASNASRVNDLIRAAHSRVNDDSGQPYQALACHLLFPRMLSGRAGTGRNDLEYFEISGELPIVLATLESDEGTRGLEELLRIHRYWRAKGIRSDLVVVSNHSSQDLETMVTEFNDETTAMSDGAMFTHPGWVILEEMGSLDEMQLDSLRAAARIEVGCDGFDLQALLQRLESGP